jgi:hypothetical protein
MIHDLSIGCAGQWMVEFISVARLSQASRTGGKVSLPHDHLVLPTSARDGSKARIPIHRHDRASPSPNYTRPTNNDSKKCRLVFALSSLPTPWLWRVQRPKRANLPNTVYRYHGSGTLFPGPRSGNLLELFYRGDQKGAVSSQLSAP